jgi:hypothetical protein
MKACGEVEVNGQLKVPAALTLGKETLIHINKRLGGSQLWLVTFRDQINSYINLHL